MTEPTIREAKSDDVPAIQTIAERAWTAAYGDFLPQETIDTAMTEWYDAASLREFVVDDDLAYAVAELDGHAVGYVSGSIGESEDVARLGAIYVDPDHWQEGIGTALLEDFEAFCRRRNCLVVEFQVLAENAVGTAFYRSRGYEVVDERETDLFGEQVRELLFRGRVD